MVQVDGGVVGLARGRVREWRDLLIGGSQFDGMMSGWAGRDRSPRDSFSTVSYRLPQQFL